MQLEDPLDAHDIVVATLSQVAFGLNENAEITGAAGCVGGGGGGKAVTAKLVADAAVPDVVVTVRKPLHGAMFCGTVRVIDDGELTAGLTPRPQIVALETLMKLVPMIWIAVPGGPDVGEKPLIVGADGDPEVTTKPLLVPVPPPLLTRQ